MAAEALNALLNNEKRCDIIQYGLQGIKSILAIYDNPEQHVPCVHIAGTNGKGTTAHATASIFTRAGYRVGLYTSPHLRRLNERITVDGREIPDDVLDRYAAELMTPGILDAAPGLTWFDALTLIAFRYFRDAGAEIAVLEAGLGGRLDSTNCVTPACSIITSISLDHCHILGNTIAEIAREKAGIIKPGVPVVTSEGDTEAGAVIARTCAEQGAPLYRLGAEFGISCAERDARTSLCAYRLGNEEHGYSLPGLRINFPMEFQVRNVSLAITAARLLAGRFPRVTGERIREGVAEVRVPGRAEVLSASPLVIFDPAHNPAAIEAITGYLAAAYPGMRLSTVLSVMRDKDYERITAILRERSTLLCYCELDDARAWRPGRDRREFDYYCASPGELALLRPSLAGEDRLVLFTGTFRNYETALAWAR